MTAHGSYRQRGMLAAVALLTLVAQGCVGPAAHGPMGCCGHHGGGLIQFSGFGHRHGHHDSCDGCGERYFDEWINHPPKCSDHCCQGAIVCDQPSRPLIHGFPSLWGYRCDPPPTECDSPLCNRWARKPLCQPECGCGGATCGFETVPHHDSGCTSCQSPSTPAMIRRGPVHHAPSHGGTVHHGTVHHGVPGPVPMSSPSGPTKVQRGHSEHGSSVLQTPRSSGSGPAPAPSNGDQTRVVPRPRPTTQTAPASHPQRTTSPPRIIRAAPAVLNQPTNQPQASQPSRTTQPVQPASQIFVPR